MRVLVVNSGSSSVKYRVIDPEAGTTLVHGLVERVTDHAAAIAEAIGAAGGEPLDVVAHRVVHGGPRFHQAALVDDDVLHEIEAAAVLAPLHNPKNLAGIRAARAALPGVPQVAVFDTAFHNRLPRRARTYALPAELSDTLGLRRYGFHGTSHAYVAAEAARFLKRPLAELRLLSMHLGSGASVCAIEHGHSTDTSMGMTPLEGLVMGTRAGDVDAGVVLALLRSGRSVDEVDHLLNEQSGLLGLAGGSADLRDIERRAADGDDRARLAISVFAHRARKYLGAYAAGMGGLDVVVLTAGIGERSAAMRQRILQRLEFLGLVLDEDRNSAARVGDDAPVARISADGSRVEVLVVATNEELRIAREAAAVVEAGRPKPGPGPIPIAVSARHVHLTPEAFAVLFGPGAELTRQKDISQPGQFASEQKVNLVGPRDRIDGVRILGPFRKKNQVEVSRTDEFKLGVDAPIRDSGNVAGSAPITLEGPAGTLRLEEGLICAHRHVHMSPADAAARGVKDGDEVEIAITGGPRDLVFGDVMVRVSDRFVLEMHIDTDEANAAELGGGASGELTYTPVLRAQGDIRGKRPPH
ncbi:MAG: acetate/propionate family kinase [Deltaproteobacteria bacterium]|nr:acetate/propionate family kinase [Deltaproteobacteria bacterium]